MAIAAGRRLSDRLFGGVKGAKVDYTNVPVRSTDLKYYFFVVGQFYVVRSRGAR